MRGFISLLQILLKVTQGSKYVGLEMQTIGEKIRG
jgi:hypothetical protein